ncbi:hypothetical protein FRB90_000706 [Tulasnella sp. 427]|nr:hypothetical protein FRB90_000706 [Tulasnella sp. 427]
MHKSSQGLKIKKILHNEGSSTPSSSASPATPSLELAPGPPSIFQPNFNPVHGVPYQPDSYDRNRMPPAEVYVANDIGPDPSRPFYMTYEMPVLPTPSAYSYYPTNHHHL